MPLLEPGAESPNFEMPSPIEVDVPLPRGESDNIQASRLHTTIFPENAYIAEALTAMYAQLDAGGIDTSAFKDKREKGSGPTVAVAGCSVGAPNTSLAAIHNAYGLPGSLDIRGIDNNWNALREGIKDRYIIPSALYDDEELDRIQSDLENFGFMIDTDTPTSLGTTAIYGGEGYQVDAYHVQLKHKLSVVDRDLTQMAPFVGEADLVQASNFLPHLDADSATKAARNFAAMGKENVVVNFGKVKDPEIVPMGGLEVLDEPHMTYREWIGDTAVMLYNEFGMLPIPMEDETMPIMFARQ